MHFFSMCRRHRRAVIVVGWFIQLCLIARQIVTQVQMSRVMYNDNDDNNDKTM